MVLSRTLLGLLSLVGPSIAAYVLQDNYSKDNFFQQFDFFSASDPTHGHVKYVDGATANKQGLAGFAKDQIFLGVDHKTANAAGGRQSTRVSSKKQYTHGLFIADITHMPVGCGVWPALWTFGPNWPTSGEIDIIEGVHTSTHNAVTLHTDGNTCKMTNAGSVFEGRKALKYGGDCGSPGGKGNDGCGQELDDGNNYGEAFNSNQGGVYAMEWTDQAVAVWFFPRNSVNANALSNNPNPASWGKPLARFQPSGCDMKKHFKNHNIIINTSLCGDWAGQVWGQFPSCAAKAPTCQEFVTKNAGAFANAYWTIKSIKVFQSGGAKRDGLTVRQFTA